MSAKLKHIPMSLEAILDGIPGGIPLVVQHVRRLAFKDEGYAKWVELYDANEELQDARVKRSLDQISADAKVDVSQLLGDVVASAHKWGEYVVSLAASAIAQQRASDVIERSYIEAAKPEGFADRNKLLQKHGVHPAPKGMVISMNQGVQLNAGGGFDFEKETSELADIFNEDQPLLNAGDEDYIDTENIESEEREHEFVRSDD